jgi:hypothetical protein
VGRFVAEAAATPAGVELVSVCGPTCFAGELSPTGDFAVAIGQRLDLDQYSVLLHGRPRYAGFYFPVPEPDQRVLELGTLRAFALPTRGATLPAATDAPVAVAHEGVELQVPAGAELQRDFESLSAGELDADFRVRLLEPDEFAGLGAIPVHAALVVAFAPFESQFLTDSGNSRARLGLALPNTPEAAPGTGFELHALGSYLYPDYVAPARFEPVATALVSDDGARIETRPGEGIELLTWIALVPSE